MSESTARLDTFPEFFVSSDDEVDCAPDDNGDDVFVVAAKAKLSRNWFKLFSMDIPNSLGSKNLRGAGAELASLADGCERYDKHEEDDGMLDIEVVVVVAVAAAAAVAVESFVLVEDAFAVLEDAGVAVVVVDDEAQNVPVGCSSCCSCNATPLLEKLLLELTTPPQLFISALLLSPHCRK